MKVLDTFKKLEKPMTFLLFLGLIVLNVISFHSIAVLQGDARVVNYTGIVRGATQQLVKQEMAGEKNEALLERLEGIVKELRTGVGDNHLQHFEDEEYQTALRTLQKQWDELVAAIVERRETGENSRLYALSEEIFKTANRVVFLAENISENKLVKTLSLRFLLLVFSLALLVIFTYQFVDMLRLQMKNKQLEEKASIDQMTGLPNRWMCDKKIEYYKGFRVLPNLLCASIDLNNLKKLNDSYGHAVGDQLIVSFARVLNIVASPYGFVGRNGGDEFLGFFEDFSEEKERRFRAELMEQVEVRNEKEEIVKMSFAYGSALSSELENATIFDLLKISDERMYQDKKLSKGGRDHSGLQIHVQDRT